MQAGFLGIYDTITNTIKSSLPPRGKVHLVGHSLGGALANLLAVQLSMSRGYDVEPYTFGAPRVGGRNFSTILESRVGAANIHRVYDVADPVPLVPVFPYLHAPSAGGIRVGTSSLLINPDNHDMKDNYTRLVDGKVWASLQAASRDVVRYSNLDDLLNMASIHSSIAGGSMGLWVLGKALQALIDVSVLITGGVLYAAESLLDKLALLLMNAARASAELAGKILNFMTMVLKWTGRAASSAAEMTARFLSWVLGLLLSPIANLCNRALNRLG